MRTCYTREQIQQAIISKGYKWFTGGSLDKDYDINIVGVRNSDTDNEITNKFDDCITVSYKLDGVWNFHCYESTTDPGKHWAENIMNKHGVAILKPGQYRGSHKIRLHQGKYPALGQQKPVVVYRDNNKDSKYDLSEDNTMEGLYGINIHRATKYAGRKSTQVDRWSAGCQVIAANDDWHEFLDICYEAKAIWGNSFTYTLIESRDIV